VLGDLSAGTRRVDLLFIQVKEAQHPVLEPHFDATAYTNQGQRVVAGQRLLQGSPDIFLGWGELDGVQYYVRQLRDMKSGVTLEPGRMQTKSIPVYTKLCRRALALAHAKSGDAALLSGYLGNCDTEDNAILSFAKTYARQNDRDYLALKTAAASGRIKVATASEAGLVK
jgi:hypothetical protein